MKRITILIEENEYESLVNLINKNYLVEVKSILNILKEKGKIIVD